MTHSQEYLDGLWLKLKSQPISDYAPERITNDSALVQGLEIDVQDAVDVGKSAVAPYIRKRENSNVEWGLWEQGFSASI
jgi:hypothetical protein